MIVTSYIIQIMCIAAVISSIFFGFVSFIHADYFWALMNAITVPINVANVVSLYNSRRRIRELRGPAFSKHDNCSCGARDWGTVLRQYDEVPVCRNCWNTWKGK